MRKLVASFFMSLDGVVQGPGPEDDFELAGWTMPYWDDDVAAFVQAGRDAHYGRPDYMFRVRLQRISVP